MEIRLQRLRAARPRPGRGRAGRTAPKSIRTRCRRSGSVCASCASAPGRSPTSLSGPPHLSPLGQQPRPAPQMAPPEGNGAAGNPANAVKQLAAQTCRRCGPAAATRFPGTAYTEDGIVNFVAMLKAKTDLHPFFERIHKFCTSPGQDPDMMLNGVNLANLSRTVELMEQIEANGVRGLRERFGGQAGGPGGGAGMGAGMGGGWRTAGAGRGRSGQRRRLWRAARSGGDSRQWRRFRAVARAGRRGPGQCDARTPPGGRGGGPASRNGGGAPIRTREGQ